MALLKDILYKVHIRSVHGSTAVEIKDLQIDSRNAKAGTCFIAILGVITDGHQYIKRAIENGCTAVVCQTLPDQLYDHVTYIEVADSAEAAGYMANQIHGNVSEKIKVIGVTGTNGKTTIATLLYKLFSALGYKCGLISTIEYYIGNNVFPSTHTTPDVISLNNLLKQMYDEDCTHVFMECSSHAIHQHRITGIEFTGALFSNITHDHLDYHQSFDEYIRVKKSFFDNLGSNAFAISNKDDKRGEVMLQNTKAHKLYYSLKSVADFKGKILDDSLTGLHMMINHDEVHFRLIGEFNAYNILAVYAAAVSLKEEKQKILLILSNLTGAEGRFDYVISPVELILGIVDYAHTPDALENVLATIKKLKRGNEQIITVVGCGGDRDTTKRPLMGQVACDLSDRVIFTSDNPRTEDPLEILADMEFGLTSSAKKKFISIADRKEAIKTAVNLAKREDIILVAGKGHEKYQDIKGVKYEFDDKKVLNDMFTLLEK